MAATQIAETRYIVRGMLAGLAGGAAAFTFARIFAEPVIQSAINYESARDAAQDALDKAQGLAIPPAGPDIFSRGIQANIGIGVGLIFFGFALGGILSVLYVLATRRWPKVPPRTLAALVALACFAGLYLVPILKYPANPPSIGHPTTIRARSELYLIMTAVSVIALGASIVSAQRLATRFGTWNGTLLAALGFAIVVGVVMVILPPLGHLSDNVVQYGRHSTETPLPLTDKAGRIVFPGFPADVLFKFRLYSMLNQVVLWGTLGLVYGPLVQRMINGAVAKDRAASAPLGEHEGALSA
jgi:hypothetical protein